MRSHSAIVLALAAIESFASPVKPRATSGFTYYNLNGPVDQAPCDMDTGSDGNIYVDTFLSNKIVKIDRHVSPYTVTEYDIPYTLPVLNDSVIPSALQGTLALTCVVRSGKDGKIYAAAGLRNEFVVFDPSTEDVQVYDTGNPLGDLQPFNDAWPGETGMFFSQTTGNVISLFDYETHEITNYEVPTPLAGPLGMKVAADGALWFVETLANKIARLNSTSGEIVEFDLPLSLATPAVLRAETSNGDIFFTALASNAIGSFNIWTHDIKTFTSPTLLSTPAEDTLDSDGNVWFSTATQNSLYYLNPTTGVITSIPQPDAGLLPGVLPSLPPAIDIAIHYEPSDNTIWFAETVNNRVGRYQIPS